MLEKRTLCSVGKIASTVPMYKVISSESLELRPDGTVKFEGADYGIEASFFHTRSQPGTGSQLHQHPYAETWLVRSGLVRFTVGEHGFDACSGEIVVAAANVPHQFLNIGNELLEMFCVHPASKIVQELVEE
jgi:mannose-6-phosphate isomerase-like protein (cupin superfamily)